MTPWYVIRLGHDASRPSRQDGRKLNIEWELSQAGFDYYVPIEPKDIIHHRTKKRIEKRFPMIPGYAFLHDPRNFWTIAECKYISGVLGVDGVPLAIPQREIDQLRDAEAALVEALERTRARRMKEGRAKTRRNLAESYPSGAAIVATAGYLSGQRARIESVTGRQTVKAFVEKLGALIEFPVDDIALAD